LLVLLLEVLEDLYLDHPLQGQVGLLSQGLEVRLYLFQVAYLFPFREDLKVLEGLFKLVIMEQQGMAISQSP